MNSPVNKAIAECSGRSITFGSGGDRVKLFVEELEIGLAVYEHLRRRGFTAGKLYFLVPGVPRPLSGLIGVVAEVEVEVTQEKVSEP